MGSPQKSGGEPLAGGAGGLREQAKEGGPSVGKGGMLAHVADACGEGDGDGPAPEQGQKPLRRLAARVVRVECEEDAGAAPEGGGQPLNALGTQGGDGWETPSGKGEPVEDPLGDDRPGRRRAEAPEAKHRLGAGRGLEAGRPVGVYGPPDEPADEAAGDVGNDHHPGEPLRAPLHEQPAVPDALLGEAAGLQGLPQPASVSAMRRAAGCGGLADAPRGQVPPRFCVTPEPSGVEARRRREQGGVAGRQRGGLGTPRSG